MPAGTLYLIPVPLAEDAAARSFTPYLVDTINQISEYIVENEKTARKFLKLAGLTIPQSELVIHDYGKHQRNTGIADPGADIVAEAHRRSIKVVPLVGPSSILLALMASGFNGQSFTFHGYLPIDKEQRSKRIKDLEGQAERLNQTQLFIETPFRNNQILNEILKVCKSATRLCVACNLTAANELVETKTVSEWKKQQPDLHKQPAIFLLYKS
jgi:16S rRNA (cytidine1402-2'-O)-methyltransferase